MSHFKTISSVGLFMSTAFVVGCGSGGLPSNLEQTSVQSAPDQAPQYQTLALPAPNNITVLTQGATAQFQATGGKLPYTYSVNGGTIDAAGGLYTASAVGSFQVVVTDARNLTASITMVINAPVTTTTTTTTTTTVVTPPPPPPPPPPTVGIDRWFNTIHGLHQIVPVSGAGWQADGEVYRVYQTGGTGLTALYVCQMPKSMFESTDPGCEGFPQVGPVGFIYTSQQSGTVPLVRMVRNYVHYYFGPLVDHIEIKQPSTDPSTWTIPPEFVAEGVLGFVPQ